MGQRRGDAKRGSARKAASSSRSAQDGDKAAQRKKRPSIGQSKSATNLKRKIAVLEGDLEAVRQQQVATADVLKVISRSPFDLHKVLDTLVESAAVRCGADIAVLRRRIGTAYQVAATYGYRPDWREHIEQYSPEPRPGSIFGRVALEDCTVHIPDIFADPEYARPETQQMLGFRASLGVPLHREGSQIGILVLQRFAPGPFTASQIELVETFADQAVIAIENVRLFDQVQARTRELTEALEQQTATAEVLQIINSSPGDLAPVFDAILEKAHSLCGVAFGSLQLYDGGMFRAVAVHGLSEAFAHELRQGYSAGPKDPSQRLMEGARFAHISDLAEIDDPLGRAAFELSGIRTALFIPLRKDGTLLGQIVASRREVRPFTDKDIALLNSFAAQAVIAMENARLITETRESLERQTATAEVLEVINSSPGDLAPVFDAMLEKATELCEAKFGCLFLYDGKAFTVVADRNLPPAYAQMVRGQPLSADSNTALRHMAENKAPLHLADMFADGAYSKREPLRTATVDLGGVRSLINVPLLNKGELIGFFAIYKGESGGFPENQIALVTTFANQAVIAIENARLFEELREREAELRVTFDNMGDGIAMFDSELRLAAWNLNLQEILDLPDALLAGRPSYADYLRMLAERGEFGTDDVEGELNRPLENTDQELRMERIRPDGSVIEVRRNAVPDGGFVLIYADITGRKRAEEAISTARDAAERALRDLQRAQASLLHAQKMAALGQLTAGIAHEIKNPLNFVNNFADLSVELLNELKEATAPAVTALDDDKRNEIDESFELLTSNLDKIAGHGRRADGIVRSMLAHSRGGSGDWQSVDLNGVIEEALNLAYHGARAQDQGFNATLERDLGSGIGPIEIVPQDMTRVFLNLISNGFYAVTKRARQGDGSFRPVLKVATRDLGDTVEIRVRDNGTGIAPEHRERLFQPFFTTKPTGEGTGLGLSISYDIVTQQHGGTITVDSEAGAFTEFVVSLPRRRRVTTEGTAA